jgi:carboxypeptidase Q
MSRSLLAALAIFLLGHGAAMASGPSPGSPAVLPAGLPAGLPAELLDEAAALRDSALAEADPWRHAWSLTTEVGPRLAGSAGDRAAVAWALANLAVLGFDDIRPQTVIVPAWQRGQAEVRITRPFPQPLVAVALGMTVGTPEEGLEGPVLRYESLAELEAAPSSEVRSHIVFIDEAMERTRDGSGYSPAVQKRSRGPSIASGKGAIAMVIRSVGTSTDRLPHTGNTRFAEGVRPIPAFALSGPDADMLTRQMSTRREVQLYVRSTARSLPPARSANVIADIRGEERPDEIVILAAHLDSWDLGTGAIDNAAGVAILLETAQLIASRQRRPTRTIRVVLFANEEAGLDGSRTYTAAALESDERHVVGIEADSGAGFVYALSSGVGDAALPIVDAMRKVLVPLGIEGGDNTATGGADLSTLRAAGMPLLSLNQDMSQYFDWHHTANDTLDKIDTEALRHAVAAYAAVVWIAANAEADFGVFPGATPDVAE